ncbi:alpha/beta fold hydrolase [Acinetobacter sp. ANC 3791]|uniref:alpha/beta fold hydrolase n=1 Tax=Acinetobacter sp. ANC 3791 TaxID=2529836 RepID=UPI0010406F16|nr:alpha/beta hydrolase [Acinetobacter sp. ANC 3791]TCB83171.1 alpha/beta hydrolase [Acinetobacter sp. ANC 3791]
MLSPLPTVVFIPGLLNDEKLWQHQTNALSQHMNVMIADLSQDDNLPAMAKRILNQAPEKFALVGLSMGGYVAFEVLRQAPKRVIKLALFDTSARPDSVTSAKHRQATIHSLKVGKFMGVTNKLLPQIIHPSRVHDPIGEEIKAMAQRIGGSGFINQQKAILGRIDSRPFLADIHIPTLVAVGENDLVTPVKLAQEMHEGIQNSQLHIFKHCGHLPPLECPEETTALLQRWLAS